MKTLKDLTAEQKQALIDAPIHKMEELSIEFGLMKSKAPITPKVVKTKKVVKPTTTKVATISKSKANKLSTMEKKYRRYLKLKQEWMDNNCIGNEPHDPYGDSGFWGYMEKWNARHSNEEGRNIYLTEWYARKHSGY